MSQQVPFAASLPGKLANASAAIFFQTMALTGLNSEPKDFSVLFIVMTCVAICGYINSVTLAMADYPKETLTMVLVVPFAAGPLLAWTMIAGGGETWKAYTFGTLALVFAAFVVKPPKIRIWG